MARKDTDAYYMQFIAPLFTVLHPLYFIKVVSDRWICNDNILPLSFKNIILPAEFPPPTELQDLQSVSANSFALAKEMKISHFNQVQTQVLPSLINNKMGGRNENKV